MHIYYIHILIQILYIYKIILGNLIIWKKKKTRIKQKLHWLDKQFFGNHVISLVIANQAWTLWIYKYIYAYNYINLIVVIL